MERNSYSSSFLFLIPLSLPPLLFLTVFSLMLLLLLSVSLFSCLPVLSSVPFLFCLFPVPCFVLLSSHMFSLRPPPCPCPFLPSSTLPRLPPVSHVLSPPLSPLPFVCVAMDAPFTRLVFKSTLFLHPAALPSPPPRTWKCLAR